MDYKTQLQKYEQEQKLRFVVEKWTKDTIERSVHLMDLLKDWTEDITGHFTLLDPKTRTRIFNEVYPKSRVKARYQSSMDFNDTGNAQRLIERHGKDILHISPEGYDWYTWDERRWKEDEGEKRLYQLAKDTADSIREMKKDVPKPEAGSPQELLDAYLKDLDRIDKWANSSLSEKGLKSMLALAGKEQAVSAHYTDLNTHPYLFNAQNGTIDLHNGELLLPQREHRMTQLAPVAHEPVTPIPNWIHFLKTIFQGDEQMLRYIQWLFGYFLIGHNLNQKLYMFVGEGKNGKSTILKVARELLGIDYSKLMDFSVMSQSTDVKAARHDLAEFFGKRLIVISESNRDQVLAEGVVKRFTGEDIIIGEKKYGRPFEVPITFKTVMMSQHLPRIIGQDTGIWRRLVVIPFPYQIPEEDRDPNFFNHTLRHELPGILAWAVEGAKMYQDVKEQDILPDVCRAAFTSYQEDTDFFGQFMEECLTVQPGGFLAQDELMNVAKKWGSMNNCQSLINSGTHNLKTMFASNPLTKNTVTYSRKRVKDDSEGREGTGFSRKYGFDGVILSERGQQLLLGKDMSAVNFMGKLSENFRKNFKNN